MGQSKSKVRLSKLQCILSEIGWVTEGGIEDDGRNLRERGFGGGKRRFGHVSHWSVFGASRHAPRANALTTHPPPTDLHTVPAALHCIGQGKAHAV